MYSQKLLQLLPYMALHLLLAVVLCLAAYWTLVKWLKVWQIRWPVAVVAAIFLFFYSWGGVLINMIDFHHGEAPSQAANQQSPPEAKTPIELKGAFLKAVDDLTGHPEMIKPEVISQLFSQYAELFKTPDDKKQYFTNIMHIYECQRYFLMDAETSQFARTPIKSPERTACEKADGSFFGRATLLAPEVIDNNNKLIAKVSSEDRLTGEFPVSVIKKTLDQQNLRIEAAKKIFE